MNGEQRLIARVDRFLVRQKIYWKVHPRDLWGYNQEEPSDEELAEFPSVSEQEPGREGKSNLKDRVVDLFIEKPDTILNYRKISDSLQAGVTNVRNTVSQLTQSGILEESSKGYRLASQYRRYGQQLMKKVA